MLLSPLETFISLTKSNESREGDVGGLGRHIDAAVLGPQLSDSPVTTSSHLKLLGA